MDHQHVFGQAGLSKVLATVVLLFWQTGQGGEWQVIWCLGKHQIIHEVESLCISTMWLFKFFLLKSSNCKSGKIDQGEFDYHALLQHQAVLPILLIPSLPLHLLLAVTISLLLPPSSSFSPYFRRFGRPPGPASSLSGTCRTVTGLSVYRPCLLLSQCSKIMTVLKTFTS